MKSRAEKES